MNTTDTDQRQPSNQFIPEEQDETKSYLNEQILIDGKPYSFVEYGKEYGSNTNGQTETLPKAYDKIYKHLLENSGLDASSISRRITKLESEKARRETEVTENEKLINDNNSIIDKHQKEVDELKEEIKSIKSGGLSINKANKNIITAALWFATFYLFGLYFYYAYFVFGGKAPNGSRISTFGDLFQVPVWSMIFQNNSYFSLLIYLGLPGLFFLLAYKMHHFYDTKKKIMFWVVFVGTFLIDLGISYKLAKMIHDDEFIAVRASGGVSFNPTSPSDSLQVNGTIQAQTEKVNELNNWSAWSDSNFWTLVGLGFLAYVFWGIGLSVYNQITNPQKKIEDLKKDILLLDSQIAGLKTENQKISATILLIKKDIDKIIRDIDALKSGVIPIDYPKLKSLLGLFMQGWFQFVVFKWDKDDETQKSKIDLGNEQQSTWLSEKQGTIKASL